MQGLSATIAMALFVVAPPAGGVEDTLSYSGSSTIGVGIMQAGAVKVFEARTGLKFASVETIGSSKGVKALIEGKVTVAGASRALTSEDKKQDPLKMEDVVGENGIRKLAEMEHGRLSRDAFMAEIAKMAERIVKKAKEYDRDTIPGDYATLKTPCPN